MENCMVSKERSVKLDKSAGNAPSLEEWNQLYKEAVEFKALTPWKWMHDSDLFGVQNPADGEVGYCCVLGAAGEVFGLAVYLGDQGLKGYFKAVEWADNPTDDKDILHFKKCFLLSFENRAGLEAPDLEVIKNLGLQFQGRNAWPLFRYYEPGYFPWYLTAEQARYLTLCLTEANGVVLRFKKELSGCAGSVHTGKFFSRMYENRTKQYKDAQLSPTPMKEMVVMVKKIDPARLEEIIHISKRTEMTWEMDTFHAPTVVGEKDQRPYFPILFLLADRDSYFVLDVHLTEPGRYPAELHEEFLKAIEKNKVIPQEIRVRKEELRVYLGPLAERLGIRVRLAGALPSVNEARKGMSEFFKKGTHK